MRRHHPLLIAIIGMLFLSRTVAAQSKQEFEIISTNQGLAQGMINDMIQDKEGFIWIATKGGLNRYDGYNFKTFTTDPQDIHSISSNAISNLLEDSKGRIWVGTYDGGINVYSKKSGRFHRIIQVPGNTTGLSGNRIESAMIEMPDGRILVCPDGGGLQLIALPETDKNPDPVISNVNIPADIVIHGICKDDKGFVWVSCRESFRIYIYNPVSGLELLSDGKTFTQLITKVGGKFTARYSQVVLLKPDPLRSVNLMDSTGNLYPAMIRELEDGQLLLNDRFSLRPGTFGCLFYDFSKCRPGDNIVDFPGWSMQAASGGPHIKTLLLDRSGILWVGTSGYGLYKFPIRNRRFHAMLQGFSPQRITALHNRLFIQGWSVSQMVNIEGEKTDNLLSLISISNSLLQVTNGDYWMYDLHQKTLSRYNASLKLLSRWKDPIDHTRTEQIQPVLEDSKGNIWVSGANGSLAKIDIVTGEMTKYLINTAGSASKAGMIQSNAFFEDAQGNFWLGTEFGFAKLEFINGAASPKTTWFKNIPNDKNSLSYNYVSWFMDDPSDNNYLWIATKGGGINRFDKSSRQFIRYSSKDGLPNDVVYGLLADNAGNIWGSTNRGLFCMLAAKPSARTAFRLFGSADGLQADEFNTNAFAKLPNGKLVFGGVNGINIFDPQKVLARNFSPTVFITGIQVGNKTITPGDKSGVLKQTIEQAAAITLTHLQDVLTLEFSSLDFTSPLQNKYRYRLVGIDNDWVESDTRRSATYMHLPAGNYVFKVQGSNSQGLWSEDIAQLEIKVLPPWWRSWWAYMIYAILAIVVVRTWIQFNINRAKLRAQLSLEQIEAKRAKELDSLKTQLYTNITHEFRTPLTVILGMAQQVKEKPQEHFENRMDMIVRNGNNLLNLVNEMLDLSKLETGKMQLQLTKTDVIGFLKYVVESFYSLANSQDKQLHFLSEIDALYLEYDREKLSQIVSNLLSNAIKFTPEKGNIYITVSERLANTEQDHTMLLIKVKDTGIGIPEDELPHIFDRFYQADNSHTRKAEGTGIGLALTRELIKLMDGEITVKSPPTGTVKGSEFTVMLPLKRAMNNENSVKEIPYQTNSDVQTTTVLATLNSTKQEKTNVPLILLVEDNADVVAYTASCLTDYRLAVGKDGREGFEIATEIIPDLVITDIMMPFVDGFELTAQLRSNELTSHIPVIMLTAKADMQSKIEGLQKGAEAYLEKPFNKEELLVRIQKLLEMRKNLQQYYLKTAGIQYGIARQVSEETPFVKTTNVEEKEDGFVQKVREAIELNLTDIHFTVEKLCKLVFMSHSQMHRKLEALTGCSPNKFIRMIRMKKAKELLQDPANSIGSIALDCGYADPGYFGRVFKQEFGVTPQEWRAKTVAVQ